MTVLGFAFYILLWWMAFFTVLPLGVRNLDEAGVESVPGVERGAPAAPSLMRKALIAAAIAAIVWIVLFVLWKTGVLNYRR